MNFTRAFILLTLIVIPAGTSFAQPASPTKTAAGKAADDYFRLGFDEYNKNNTAASISAYTECVKLSPAHRDCYYNRAHSYLKNNENGKAIADLTKAISLSPQVASAYNVRGRAYYLNRDYANAIKDYSAGLKLDPKNFGAFHNRGLAYYYIQKPALSIADMTQALKINPKDAASWYFRGKVRSERGDKVNAIIDLKEALKLDPAHANAKTLLASLESKTTPATAAKLPVLSELLAKQNGPRMELKGTGLSVQSPVPFMLQQDKPDPFIENQTANVFWTLNHKGIFANVSYIKETGTKTPRQDLEATTKLVSEMNNAPMPRIVDVNFLGQPAVQFEEEFVDAYDPKKEKRKRKMLAYGSAGEITSIQISYPAADANAATAADQMFKSFQKAGALAQEISKVPPANWQYVDLRGLRFEVPDAKAARSCGVKVTGPTAYDSAPICYEWGGNTIVRAEYRSYNVTVPSPGLAAQMYITTAKQIDIDTNSKAARTYTTETITIAGAEAVKVKAYSGYGTVGSNEEIFFIRRGRDFWMLHAYEFIRWNYNKEAVQRIVRSIKF